MTESTSQRRDEQGLAVDGIVAAISDGARTVEVGLFTGDLWTGCVELGRVRALELHRQLEDAIRWFWPQALPDFDAEKRSNALYDALTAAMTWIEQHRARLSAQDVEGEREVESLLIDIREALILGREFEALRELRELLSRRALEAVSLESTCQDIRYVVLRALRLAGRQGSALRNATDR